MHVLGDHGLQVHTVARHLVFSQNLDVGSQEGPSKFQRAAYPAFLAVHFSAQRTPGFGTFGRFSWITADAQLRHFLAQSQLLVRWPSLIDPHLRLPHNLELVKVVDVEGEEIPGSGERTQWGWLTHSYHPARVELCLSCQGFETILDEIHHVVPSHRCTADSGKCSFSDAIVERSSTRFPIEDEIPPPCITWAVDVKAVLLILGTA